VKSISKPTIFDFIVLFTFLFFSSVLTYFSYSKTSSIQGNFVEIYQNNKLISKQPLAKEQELNFKNFVVEIKNNKVRMKESNCPHKICVHTGWISRPYQQIVCVPNKVYIKISSEKNYNKIDSVTY